MANGSQSISPQRCEGDNTVSHKTIQQFVRESAPYRKGEVFRPSIISSVMSARGRSTEHRVIVNALGEMVRTGELVKTDGGYKRERMIQRVLAMPWRKHSDEELGIVA